MRNTALETPLSAAEQGGMAAVSVTRDVSPVVHVACGVLVDAAGNVLLAQRPPGKLAAGKWEFPGGKIERGESAREALARELHEELGVHVRHAEPLARLRQDYADRVVWLDTWVVTAFDGVAAPCEGQRLAWTAPGSIGTFDVLPSCWRVAAALALPRHYVFTPPDADFAWLAVRLADLPVGSLLRLRLPHLDDEHYVAAACALHGPASNRGIRLLLDRDPALALELSGAGWHADVRRLRALNARPLPRDRLFTASAHDQDELAVAHAFDADAAVLAPVQPTTTHAGATPLGWSGFAVLAGQAGLPVYALGGLGPGDLETARAHRAHGVAGIRAYWPR